VTHLAIMKANGSAKMEGSVLQLLDIKRFNF